ELHTTLRYSNIKSIQHCNIGFIEYLPADVYIDIYELEQMSKLMKDPFSFHVFNKHVDLEKPTPDSQPVLVAFSKFINSKGEVNFTIPIHFRYQAPSFSHSFKTVKILPPIETFVSGTNCLSSNATNFEEVLKTRIERKEE